jgi:hypothetical protein
MTSTPPEDSDRSRPSVPPPVIISTPAASSDEVADAAMPVGAPIHRQYLDRTTTTSVITLGYRPTRELVRRVYAVGIGMALVAIVAAIPALMFLPFGEAPIWARLVLLASAIQLAYVGWMMLVPDWSTVRSTMFLFVGVAAAYGFAMATAIATPAGAPVTFEMGPVRTNAIQWCAVVMGLIAIATFFSGRLAFRWRKGYVEANSE